MSTRTYHDFVLLTQPVDTHAAGAPPAFSVLVLESPMGEGEKMERREIRDYAELKAQTRKLAAGELTPQEQIDLGKRLAELLLPDYALDLFRRCRAWLYEHPDAGLRLRLRLTDELQPLPWEFLHHQEAGGEPLPTNFLALDPQISIVRHKALAEPPDWFESQDTLRVVVAMATPGPQPEYRLLRHLLGEQQRIQDALEQAAGIEPKYLPDYRRADAETQWYTLTGARREEIKATIDERRGSVLHFSGHGEYSESVGPGGRPQGEGFLILADERNQAMPVSGAELARDLSGRGVRLVMLAACETAKGDPLYTTTEQAPLKAWSSVAAALVEKRIPSVVAMQFKVRDDLAAEFMATVYEVLVAGGTIDEAVSLGRAQIWRKAGDEGTALRDWGAPVLYSRVSDGHIFPPFTDEKARQKAQRKSDLRAQLHAASWEWMVHGATPSKSQLHRLAEEAEDLKLSPDQTLLLLRSTVFREVPVEPWLSSLRQGGTALLQRLDQPDGGDELALAEARQTLGLGDPALQDRPEEVGHLVWAAVRHPDEVARHTAALALTTPGLDDGLGRVEQALASGRAVKALGGHLRRWWRRMELRGALADADPELGLGYGQAPPWDRLGVWLWRFGRRAGRDLDRIVALALSAGLGAGLLLGLWRFVAALPAGPLATLRFGNSFFYGTVLGAAIGLGIGLAVPVWVGQRGVETQPASLRESLFGRAGWPAWLAVLLGTLLFGVAHALVALFNGLPLPEKALILGTGLLAGLGVNLALWRQPRTNGQGCLIGWMLRLATAALTAILAQWIVFLSPHPEWTATAVARDGESFARAFSSIPELSQLIQRCQDSMTVFDAAVVSVVLTVGAALGLQRGAIWLAEWQQQPGRAQD